MWNLLAAACIFVTPFPHMMCRDFLGDKLEGVVFLKPSTDRMLTRIKSVYLYIEQKGSVTTQDIVEEFGITERTVQRDLNVLDYNGLVTTHARGVWTTTGKKVKVS